MINICSAAALIWPFTKTPCVKRSEDSHHIHIIHRAEDQVGQKQRHFECPLCLGRIRHHWLKKYIFIDGDGEKPRPRWWRSVLLLCFLQLLLLFCIYSWIFFLCFWLQSSRWIHTWDTASLLFTIHPPDGPLSLFPPITWQLHPSTHLFPFHLLSLTPSSALQRFNRPFSIHPSARSCSVPLSSCRRNLPLQITSEILSVLAEMCSLLFWCYKAYFAAEQAEKRIRAKRKRQGQEGQCQYSQWRWQTLCRKCVGGKVADSGSAPAREKEPDSLFKLLFLAKGNVQGIAFNYAMADIIKGFSEVKRRCCI